MLSVGTQLHDVKFCFDVQQSSLGLIAEKSPIVTKKFKLSTLYILFVTNAYKYKTKKRKDSFPLSVSKSIIKEAPFYCFLFCVNL